MWTKRELFVIKMVREVSDSWFALFAMGNSEMVLAICAEGATHKQLPITTSDLAEDLEHTLPVATYWLDENEPLPMLLPNQVREKQRQLIALPELEKAVIPKKLAETLPIEETLAQPFPKAEPLALEESVERPTVEVLKPEEFWWQY